MNLLQAAGIIADKYHNKIMGQRRKYDELPYTVHTDAVEIIYSQYFPYDIVGRAAAKSHDTFEDTPLTVNLLRRELYDLGINPSSKEVNEMIFLILELTNSYTSEDFPNLNRAKRKRLEAIRMGNCSLKSRMIKVCDLLDNTASICQNDAGFAVTYLKEKAELLTLICDGIPNSLYHRVWEQLLTEAPKVGVDVYGHLAKINNV